VWNGATRQLEIVGNFAQRETLVTSGEVLEDLWTLTGRQGTVSVTRTAQFMVIVVLMPRLLMLLNRRKISTSSPAQSCVSMAQCT